jgi:hypothetical protein
MCFNRSMFACADLSRNGAGGFAIELQQLLMCSLRLLLLLLQGLQQRCRCGAGGEELQQGRRAPGGRVVGEWRASCVTSYVT